MMDDNDYEAYFGAPARTDDSIAASMHITTKTSFLQSGQEHTARKDIRNGYLEKQRGATSKAAGWNVAPQLVQPKIQPYRTTEAVDQEVSSNYTDMPVYDTDDGGYTDVDLDADISTIQQVVASSNKSDPQVIIIQSRKTSDEEEDTESDKRYHRSCLSRLCVRFLA